MKVENKVDSDHQPALNGDGWRGKREGGRGVWREVWDREGQ